MNLALAFWWFAGWWGGPLPVITPRPDSGTYQAEHPVLTVVAVVTRVDTTAYYVVLKVTSVSDGHRYIVLSRRTDTPLGALAVPFPSRIALGGRYTFCLQETGFLQLSEGPPLMLHFRSTYVNDVQLVEANEYAYIALNMRGHNIH